MACKGLQQMQPSLAENNEKLCWNGSESLERKVTYGMLPTLRALASSSATACGHQGRSVCFVPTGIEELDSARHLQTILLEAYCREIGIELIRMPLERMMAVADREGISTDFPCALVTNYEYDQDDPFFVEAPE